MLPAPGSCHWNTASLKVRNVAGQVHEGAMRGCCEQVLLWLTESRIVDPEPSKGVRMSQMRRMSLVVGVSLATLASAALAIAQNSSGSGSGVNPATRNVQRQMVPGSTRGVEQAPAAALPPDTPVVTLKGVCEAAKRSEGQVCNTVITREQMDQIVARLAESSPQASHKQLAINYVRVLAASQLAEDRKLQRTPAVAAELLKRKGFGRIEVLAKAFYDQIEEAAANAPLAELQQYYANHASEFEEGEVLRLSLPASGATRNGMRLDPAIVKSEADALRKLAVVGYDFDQLQAQVYQDLGIAQPPPPTRLTMARRNSMPEDQAKVFDLPPGEVTPVIESFTRLVILKLVSKRIATFESVLPEIRDRLKQERLKQEIDAAYKSVSAEFNLQYVGLSAQPALFVLQGMSSLASAATSPDQRKGATSRRRMATNVAPTTMSPQGQSRR